MDRGSGCVLLWVVCVPILFTRTRTKSGSIKNDRRFLIFEKGWVNGGRAETKIMKAAVAFSCLCIINLNHIEFVIQPHKSRAVYSMRLIG